MAKRVNHISNLSNLCRERRLETNIQVVYVSKLFLLLMELTNFSHITGYMYIKTH